MKKRKDIGLWNRKAHGQAFRYGIIQVLNGCSKFSTCHCTFLVLPRLWIRFIPQQVFSNLGARWIGYQTYLILTEKEASFPIALLWESKIISWPPRFPYFGVYASHYLLDYEKDMWLWWAITPVIILFYPGWPRFNQVTPLKAEFSWTSLVVQWLRIDLPMQGTWVHSLVPGGSVCYGTTKPTHHNHVLRLLKPVHPRACAPQQESHHSEKPGTPTRK